MHGSSYVVYYLRRRSGWRSNTGKRTKAGTIDGACEFTEQMLPNLERAMDHPDMTEELAELLSTNLVRLEYRVETDVRIGADEERPLGSPCGFLTTA